MDLQGKTLLTEELGQETTIDKHLDLSDLPVGQYNIIVQTEAGLVRENILIVR